MFVSKVVEKAAAEQIQAYLTANDLYSNLQSAYRKHHSTESALLCVMNDLLLAADKRKDAVLVLLDLSAAFDTIDHTILLNRLNSQYGITGTSLSWFESYMRGRQQAVKIGDTLSAFHELTCGVPQGSVFGPQIFMMYTAPLENIIKAHQVEGMFYADDSQLYVTFDAANKSVNLANLEDCVKDIKAWTIENKLSLNDDKTEVLHICSRYAETDVVGGIRVGTTDVSIAPEAKNLGVVVDKNLSLSSHVNQICKKACLAIRKSGRIRKYLDKESAEKLVHASVSSQLDCGNSVLFGLPEFQLAKLQRLQNTAARLVTLTKRQEHISPILHDLHWLPVKSRILYKLLLITFKALHGLAPSYIRELVVTKDPVRSLRSNAAPQLHRQSVNTVTYGQRAFTYAAPELWNRLPPHIRNASSLANFKKQLKTHLFVTK